MQADLVVPTYKGARYLPFLLKSIENQSEKPEKVIFVLKRSNDSSEEIINEFRKKINTEIIFQESGNIVTAYQLGIQTSDAEIITFTDDDAVLEKGWVEKYLNFFKENSDAGGAGGLTLKANLEKTELVLTENNFYEEKFTRETYWRKPLPEVFEYNEGVSISGFLYRKRFDADSKVLLSLHLAGANMAFKKEAIKGINLDKLFKNNKTRAYWFESILAYYALKNNFNVYRLREKSIAPIAWHIENKPSLTRRKGFWNEFWIHYDRVKMYYRLKELGARVSFPAYILACLASLRKRPFPRFLAAVYAQMF
ncbi:MAG: glycosyltransferase family A protein [Nitrososphaeria archaeon]